VRTSSQVYNPSVTAKGKGLMDRPSTGHCVSFTRAEKSQPSYPCFCETTRHPFPTRARIHMADFRSRGSYYALLTFEMVASRMRPASTEGFFNPQNPGPGAYSSKSSIGKQVCQATAYMWPRVCPNFVIDAFHDRFVPTAILSIWRGTAGAITVEESRGNLHVHRQA
jgi:hypothetical protein